MICPKCVGRTGVRDTLTFVGMILRRRYCHGCGYTFRTVEYMIDYSTTKELQARAEAEELRYLDGDISQSVVEAYAEEIHRLSKVGRIPPRKKEDDENDIGSRDDYT